MGTGTIMMIMMIMTTVTIRMRAIITIMPKDKAVACSLGPLR
jgi:hypothetical protein